MEKKKVYAVATAHLDTVWRWTLEKTIEEYLPDTIIKNLDLIRKYPNYCFNFEGAFRYELIEEYYPKLFEEIKKLVNNGRWNISGSSYENCDVNIPSPESLFRNILLGNNYFKNNFGKKSTDLFLPDCFGFSKALPTIAKHAGLNGLSTQKLTWGSANGIPFDIGIWQGVDGSKIFVSLKPGSYRTKFSGDIRGDLGIINKISDSAFNYGFPQTMSYYGTGDTGGSPDEESINAIEESVTKNSKSDFEVISASSDQLFNDLEKIGAEKYLPICNNELIMSRHGTGAYTSRGMSKRLNAQCENLADYAEKACVLGEEIGVYDYPIDRLNKAWKRFIKHQFHDDITGTSIMNVYNDTYNDYFVSQGEFKHEYVSAVGAIANKLDTSWAKECAVIVNNSSSYDRKSAVKAHIKTKHNASFIKVLDKDNNEIKSQILKKAGKEFDIIFIADVKALGYRVYNITAANSACSLKTDLKITNHSLENSKYTVLFNKNGDIASITDKHQNKQILDAPIKMALYDDTGSLSYPSWEISKDDIDKEARCYANSPEFEIVENGTARVALKITRQLDYSVITQIVSLESEGEYISVENYVDWRSRHSLLKAVFPFSVYNRSATYDLGIGIIKRDTNTDNLYEVPAQKWADITAGTGQYGVSVFSDCKYGWDKPAGNTLRLSCIHTPSGAFIKEARQDLQDIGRNRFSFAIYGHTGTFENGTQIQNELFQKKLVAFQTNASRKGILTDNFSFMHIDSDEVVVKALKLAEKKDGIIIRVAETNGKKHENAKIKFFKSIIDADNVLASEDYISKAVIKGSSIVFDIAPFEVKSFKVRLTPYKTRMTEKQIPLPLEYNSKGFTFNDNMRNVILQGGGCSLPAEQIRSSFTVGGITFKMPNPSLNADVTVARAQEIQIPESTTNIYLLCASTLSDEEVMFLADSKQIKLKVHSFNEEIGKCDMAYYKQNAYLKNATVGIEFTHTHHPEGDLFNKKAYFFIYELPVKGKHVLKFPENNKIIILAATAVNKISKTVLSTGITDKAPNAEFDFNAIPPIEKFRDKTSGVSIRAGKIEDQRNDGRGKGFRRDNIITNIIRSYTKSEW